MNKMINRIPNEQSITIVHASMDGGASYTKVSTTGRDPGDIIKKNKLLVDRLTEYSNCYPDTTTVTINSKAIKKAVSNNSEDKLVFRYVKKLSVSSNSRTTDIAASSIAYCNDDSCLKRWLSLRLFSVDRMSSSPSITLTLEGSLTS